MFSVRSSEFMTDAVGRLAGWQTKCRSDRFVNPVAFDGTAAINHQNRGFAGNQIGKPFHCAAAENKACRGVKFKVVPHDPFLNLGASRRVLHDDGDQFQGDGSGIAQGMRFAVAG